jgi:uncharacterized membrane protein YfcA
VDRTWHYGQEDGFLITFLAVWLGFKVNSNWNPVLLVASVICFLCSAALVGTIRFWMQGRPEFGVSCILVVLGIFLSAFRMMAFLTESDVSCLVTIGVLWLSCVALQVLDAKWGFKLIRRGPSATPNR